MKNLVEIVERFGDSLGLSEHTIKLASHFVEQGEKKHLHLGLRPASIPAGALYLACLLIREHRTQKEISKIAQLTTITIRTSYRALARHLIPKNINIDEWVKQILGLETDLPSFKIRKCQPEQVKKLDLPDILWKIIPIGIEDCSWDPDFGLSNVKKDPKFTKLHSEEEHIPKEQDWDGGDDLRVISGRPISLEGHDESDRSFRLIISDEEKCE